MTLPFPASLAPSNPLSGFRFFVGFSDTAGPAGALASGGVIPSVGGFSEITGLDSTIEMFDYREGGRNDYVHKFATRASFGNLSFKRGVAVTPDLFQWYDKVRQGSFGARRGIMVAHLNADGTPALVWYVSRALPTKYIGPSWNASQSSVAIESIEIAHEGLELIPTAAAGIVSAS